MSLTVRFGTWSIDKLVQEDDGFLARIVQVLALHHTRHVTHRNTWIGWQIVHQAVKKLFLEIKSIKNKVDEKESFGAADAEWRTCGSEWRRACDTGGQPGHRQRRKRWLCRQTWPYRVPVRPIKPASGRWRVWGWRLSRSVPRRTCSLRLGCGRTLLAAWKDGPLESTGTRRLERSSPSEPGSRTVQPF